MAGDPNAEEIERSSTIRIGCPTRSETRCQTLELVHLSRDQLRDLYFVDKRSQPGRWDKVTGKAARVKMPVAAMVNRARAAASGPCHYIFHSAFCCSTLMSRALDVQGVACVLREPRSLYDLGEMKRASN